MENKLIQSYRNTIHKLDGHGPRSISSLKKTALDNIDLYANADTYGNGEIINNFEAKVADLLGKEKAVFFFPSGTMAQQIALRMWCDEKKETYRVAYHPLCHLEVYEEDGLKELHHIETVLLGKKKIVYLP